MARDRQRALELEETKKQILEQQARDKENLLDRIAQLEALLQAKINGTGAGTIASPISDKGSFHEKEGQPKSDQHVFKAKKGLVILDTDCDDNPYPPLNTKGLNQCKLAVDTIDNVVALGMVFEDGEMCKTLHGAPLKEGCVRVSVDYVEVPNARLPVPIEGEMELVHQALGSHVAWPEGLVIRTLAKNKKKFDKKDEFHKLKALFEQTKVNPNVPKRYSLMYKTASSFMKETGSSIEIPCDNIVFGFPKTIFVLHENFLALLEFNQIGQAVISSYMAYLHTLVRENDDLDTFAFVDPGATHILNEGLHQYLVDRLKEGNPDRVFLMPHNSNAHCILTAIIDGEIYIMNPLHLRFRFLQGEKAVIEVVKTFNAEKGKLIEPKVTNLLGSPKQPSGHDCGYAVMRYMKEIIQDESLSFTSKWLAKTRKTYSLDQVHEVRFEVADYIQGSM